MIMRGKTMPGPVVTYFPGKLVNGYGDVLFFTTGDLLFCITEDAMYYGKAGISTVSKDHFLIGNREVPYYNILAIGIVEKTSV